MRKICLILLIILGLSHYVDAHTDVRITRPDFSQSTTAKFRLFPTQNIWTFIKLDTSNGRLWIVQYSMKDESRFEIPLSSIMRCAAEKARNGRFTLYSTSNMFTFIMLDQDSGKLWQVQWGNSVENYIVVEIN